MTWYHENWKLKRFIMIKDNKMIIVNQKNWKMTKIKGENEEHWTKKKKASLELCEQVRKLKIYK